MCIYQLEGNVGDMHMLHKDLTLEIVVNVIHCRYVFLISIVAFGSVMPCDLGIIKAHVIQSGSCLQEPLALGAIGR